MRTIASSNIVRVIPPYTLRLFIVLLTGVVVGWALILINPDLGLFALLMLLNVGTVGLLAVYFAVQSILKRESWRAVGYSYLALVIVAVVWAAVDM